jgi:hypothetical protein
MRSMAADRQGTLRPLSKHVNQNGERKVTVELKCLISVFTRPISASRAGDPESSRRRPTAAVFASRADD